MRVVCAISLSNLCPTLQAVPEGGLELGTDCPLQITLVLEQVGSKEGRRDLGGPMTLAKSTPHMEIPTEDVAPTG